jgi:hypothetical protein
MDILPSTLHKAIDSGRLKALKKKTPLAVAAPAQRPPARASAA